MDKAGYLKLDPVTGKVIGYKVYYPGNQLNRGYGPPGTNTGTNPPTNKPEAENIEKLILRSKQLGAEKFIVDKLKDELSQIESDRTN